ncbi:MAG: hypothetical protein IOD12_10180 [Silvanigrellales bacterium]|nr:hypothetical protein [Silvanigrellales bacterium]
MSPLDVSRLFVRKHEPQGNLKALPAELIALRKAIYGQETGFLEDSEIVGSNDAVGCHTLVYYDEGQGLRLVGATHGAEANACDFAQESGLSEQALARGVYMSRTLIEPTFRHQGVYPLLLWLSLSEFRTRGLDLLYAFMKPGDTPLREQMKYDFLENVPPRFVRGRGGKEYELHAVWSHIAYTLHRAWTRMPPALQCYLCDQGFLAHEVERHVARRLSSFYEGPWMSKVLAGDIQKHQYVATLANMHLFVRWTTRILAKVVGMTPDAPLRRHFIQHLKGEIDHERMLENDLEVLGADVAYVTETMSPLPSVRKFMGIQESLAAFHSDPVLFLAVPMAVEGLSAQIPGSFGAGLASAMKRWGVADPRKAMTFLGSHVHTDGGGDGHWEKTRALVARLVRTDKQLQDFLGVVHAVMDTQDEMYAAFVSLPDLTSSLATPCNDAGRGAA